MNVPFLFVGKNGGSPEITIEHNESGIDILTFETVEEDPILTGVKYEDEVHYNGKLYRVKAMDRRNGQVKVECRLDPFKLRSTFFDLKRGTDYGNSVYDLTAAVLNGAGWGMEVEGTWTGDMEALTVEERYRGSGLDILRTIHEQFGVCFRFQEETLMAAIYDPYGTDIDTPPVLLHEEVNLRDVDYKGDTYEIITRLYVYGEDENGNEINIERVNSGNDFITCYDYTSAAYVGVWHYDIPTTEAGLLAAGRRHIRKVCVPQESCQFDAIDLYRADPEKWKNYQLTVGTVAAYYDRISKSMKRAQVTKITETVGRPEKTVVELAYRPILGGVG